MYFTFVHETILSKRNYLSIHGRNMDKIHLFTAAFSCLYHKNVMDGFFTFHFCHFTYWITSFSVFLGGFLKKLSENIMCSAPRNLTAISFFWEESLLSSKLKLGSGREFIPWMSQLTVLNFFWISVLELIELSELYWEVMLSAWRNLTVEIWWQQAHTWQNKSISDSICSLPGHILT